MSKPKLTEKALIDAFEELVTKEDWADLQKKIIKETYDYLCRIRKC